MYTGGRRGRCLLTIIDEAVCGRMGNACRALGHHHHQRGRTRPYGALGGLGLGLGLRVGVDGGRRERARSNLCERRAATIHRSPCHPNRLIWPEGRKVDGGSCIMLGVGHGPSTHTPPGSLPRRGTGGHSGRNGGEGGAFAFRRKLACRRRVTGGARAMARAGPTPSPSTLSHTERPQF